MVTTQLPFSVSIACASEGRVKTKMVLAECLYFANRLSAECRSVCVAQHNYKRHTAHSPHHSGGRGRWGECLPWPKTGKCACQSPICIYPTRQTKTNVCSSWALADNAFRRWHGGSCPCWCHAIGKRCVVFRWFIVIAIQQPITCVAIHTSVMPLRATQHVWHTGDSRVYRYRYSNQQPQGELEQFTIDHRHSKGRDKGALTSAIGQGHGWHAPSIAEVKMTYFTLTDGVHESLAQMKCMSC